ncbi:hypothetical protein ACJX0J_024887, partial [Zea mays]
GEGSFPEKDIVNAKADNSKQAHFQKLLLGWAYVPSIHDGREGMSANAEGDWISRWEEERKTYEYGDESLWLRTLRKDEGNNLELFQKTFSGPCAESLEVIERIRIKIKSYQKYQIHKKKGVIAPESSLRLTTPGEFVVSGGYQPRSISLADASSIVLEQKFIMLSITGTS